MLLKVGPFVYRVVLVAGYIDHEGEPCLGLCDNETHELFVSDQCSVAQQVQVISHEFMEAWVYHFGRDGMDKEAWCDLFGLAMTQFVLDLMQTLRLDPKTWAAGMQPPPAHDPTSNDPTPTDPRTPRGPKAPRTRRPEAVRVIRLADAPPTPQAGHRDAPQNTRSDHDHDHDQIAHWRQAVVDTLKQGLRDEQDA